MMDNQSIKEEQLPQGFTTRDPNSTSSTAAEQQKLQIQEQKQMILEQALTQEALARLGRIKMVKPDKVSDKESSTIEIAGSQI